MNRWRIQQGNIAAVIYCEPDHGCGPRYTCAVHVRNSMPYTVDTEE